MASQIEEVSGSSPDGDTHRAAADGNAHRHTPGPWTARRMHTGGYDIFDPRNRDVVTVYGGGVERESCEANAHLIAAAPDLLEAARDLTSEFKARDFPQYMQDRWAALEAAIAKAVSQ